MSPPLAPIAVFRQFPNLLSHFWKRRRGRLGPMQVLYSLITMSVLGEKGYARTLDEMKQYLGEMLRWDPMVKEPTPQALSQARRKLSPTVCREAAMRVRESCTAARTEAKLAYHKLRVLAVDGAKLALPAYASLRKAFGCPAQAPNGPQASLTLLWDVGANQPVDWQLGGYRVCERVHALTLVATLSKGDLLLGDRNFSSRRIMLALREREADWLMRVRSAGPGTLKEVIAFANDGGVDAVVDLFERDHHGRPRPVAEGHLLEGAVVERPAQAAKPLRVRLLRREGPDGSVAIFITSLLDQERHPAAALLGLYAARWRIETAFRELKLWHGFERFHARYADGIHQEVAAVMIFRLLASELEAQAAIRRRQEIAAAPPGSAPPPEIRFNRRRVSDGAARLLFAATRGPAAMAEQFELAMFRIWRFRQKVRPGRSFPRVCKSTRRGWKGPSKR